MPAEPTLVEFSTRIGIDIPAENVVIIDADSGGESHDLHLDASTTMFFDDGSERDEPKKKDGAWEILEPTHVNESLLAQAYATTLDIFGILGGAVVGYLAWDTAREIR